MPDISKNIAIVYNILFTCIIKMEDIQIFAPTNKRIYIPIACSKISAGFPSPAAAYEEADLDINDILITNPIATFYVRVKGTSMIDANIHEGDILVVDRSVQPIHGKIVIAVLNGEFTVKTLYKLNGIIKLVQANPEFEEIILKDQQELDIWGVVVYTIHKN
ncbi:MAG: umuD [Burkholderiales bacterium]|nr:umuD [Burkholderiales bacterium]